VKLQSAFGIIARSNGNKLHFRDLIIRNLTLAHRICLPVKKKK